MWCGLCGFLIIKPQITLHYAVWCGAVHCYLRCCTVMPFYRRFWCGLCGLVSTPTQRGSFSKIEEDVRNSASFCDLLRLYQRRVHSAFNTSTSQLIVCHQKKKKNKICPSTNLQEKNPDMPINPNMPKTQIMKEPSNWRSNSFFFFFFFKELI